MNYKIILLLILSNSFAKLSAQEKIKFGNDSVYVYWKYTPIHKGDDTPITPDWAFPDSLPDGKWVIFFMIDSTTISELGEYHNNRKQGDFISFNFNGDTVSKVLYSNREIERETQYTENLRSYESYYNTNSIIRFITWYPNGQTKKIREVNKIIEWFENGSPRLVKNILNEVLHGEVKLWYNDGQLQYEGEWDHGKPIKSFYAKKNKQLKSIRFNKLPKEIKQELKQEIRPIW